jgi:hypothetical protein
MRQKYKYDVEQKRVRNVGEIIYLLRASLKVLSKDCFRKAEENCESYQ